MSPGFPKQLVSALCCTNDGTMLQADPACQLSANKQFVENGSIVCPNCRSAFQIDDGLVNLLDETKLDQESLHEKQLRDGHANTMTDMETPWYKNDHNLMEMVSTFSALALDRRKTVLELGCGDGRYTLSLADQSQSVLAVDFSKESLRLLQRRMNETQQIGLVLSDVTTLKVRPASFDRVLATLVSNLPTAEHRDAMYRMVASALKQDGRFVFSVHHHGFKQRWKGEPKSGRYMEGGILRYHFTVRECKKEVAKYFQRVKAWPIQIYFPFARKIRLPLVAQSRFLERIPLLNGLGCLVLCTAEQLMRII
jgi:ubiquinone/menaquinone biosynthesis C-methylase UbiE/uncharacterized protein YbaR (Trm112 family)